ncbi:hypothetical protein FEM03_21200 [Phragmitibacter flavus]|uniref:Uncharacterized protein n=1 Tax=Phragmitibacter flavus TaxID=2576071 RepID=A0A5R8K8P5_9BACT|nr:hypothetical protein [Phragmitibacter flavus]TLD68702.1 hypothetical protein FEM03_21200 [Phragmitibacter flavus]
MNTDRHRWVKVVELMVGFWLAAGGLMAGSVMKPDIDPKSGIDMELESWLERCPQAGMVPVTWKVSNATRVPLTWQLDFSSGNGYGSSAVRNSSYSITVQAGQKGELTLYVPVTQMMSGYYGGRDLEWKVTGHGVRGSGSLDSIGHSSSGTQYVGLSEGAVGTGGWNALDTELGSGSSAKELRGTELDMRKAPEDWRGYTGLAQLWMTEGEWLAMSEVARAAVQDWVGFGGRMFVLVEDLGIERVAALGLPPMIGEGHPMGAGWVRRVEWDGKVLPVKEVAKWVREEHEDLNRVLVKYDDRWTLVKQMGRLNLNTPLVFGFMVVFGLLVGPVNLFWFAGAGRRSRLFWTTPLLSIAGSLVLMVLMIVQDGFGGTGVRQVLVMLQPESKRMGVVQEQASKTGVLVGSAFAKGEPMMLTPLNVERSRSSSQMKDEFEETNQSASGSWFASRSIQAQLMMSVRPTRAAVEFFASAEPGGAPEVLSSVGVALDEVYVRDMKGAVWKVSDLGTGERRRMEASSLKELLEWMEKEMEVQAGPTMKAMLEGLRSREGFVFAVADETGDLAMESLDSIRWEGSRLLVVGPVQKDEG